MAEVDKKNIGNFKSTQHKLSENKIFLHQAKLNLEKSEAWPDLKIGPKIAFEQPFLEEDDPGVFWGGISFSIGLPIFHQNQASIRLANLGIQKASILKRFETAKLREERNYFLSSYQTNLIDFERKINMRSLKKRHDYFHKNIQKGLVAAPMVIEFHRQFMAFHQKLHEQELRLVKSYWQIKSLQNKILNELTS